MPLFDYECPECGATKEIIAKIDGFPSSVHCNECDGEAVKVIVPGHGGIKCDSMTDVPWLESAVQNLQPDHERPVETRGEYNRYLKDHNIIAAG